MVWIKNVRIETAYEEIEGRGMVTQTKNVALEIEDGLIKQIVDTVPGDGTDAIDGKNYLVSPSLQDNHIHLDKGHYGGHWQAVVPAAGVADRIKEEEGFLVDFLEDAPMKAQALIDLICGGGADFLRVQVNVDPVIEMKNVEIIQEVLEKNKDRLDYELVAFPQHGTLKTAAKGLLEEAAKNDAIDVIGSVDPATIDLDIEKSLQTTFDLAKKYDKEVDIHLHDPGELGVYEIKRVIDYTKKYDMQGKVELTHVYSLGAVDPESVIGLAKELAENKIAINTTAPIDAPAPPILLLQKYGVKVNVINDNINDHWTPFGTGDLIRVASRAAEIFSMVDEISLSQAYGLVSNGLTSLDVNGNQQWPKPGDEANILFTKAETTAHLIARVCPERVVMHKGKVVSGSFEE